MHIVAGEVSAAINIPLLHIADATATVIKADDKKTVGLLGTRFTMEEDFYRGRLQHQGLDVLVPPEKDRDIVHRVIYEELCLGKINDDSRAAFLRIIEDLRAQGAEGVIEGCTEIGLLVQQDHTDVPLYDTTKIHARQAVIEALN